MLSENIKPDYTSIAGVIRDVSDKKLLLPEFQRRFVWNIDQSKDLFDSLVRGIFIGAFMLAKPQFDLSCREIDIRPRTGKGSKAKNDSKYYKKNNFELDNSFVVLDGQQRITAIYRVLKGYDKLFFVFKKPDHLSNENEEISTMEQIVDSISIKRTPDNFCIELSEVFKCAKWKEKDIRNKIFEPCSIEYAELEDNRHLTEKYFDHLLDLKRLFSELIDDKTLLSVFFLNMGIEKFCMFFERSNSKGTELNFIDIITAKIYKDFNLDTHIKDFKEKHKSVFFDDSIVESFVRYISYLKEKKVDRKTILTSLDGSDFKDYWIEICGLYVNISNYLMSQDLIYPSVKVPYNTMFIPMIHFLRNIPHKDFSMISPTQTELFRFWFWGSLLNTRYGGGISGSTNDIIVLDCDKLEQVAKGQKFDREYLKHFKFNFTYEDLLDHTSTGAIFIGIMSILNNKYQFRNLSNKNIVDFNQPINIHHIFPTNYLENSFLEESFENENYNSILNKMLIEKIPNIKFGNNAPSVYLNKPEIIQNKEIVESLNSHLIPQPNKLIDGSFDRNYKSFTKGIPTTNHILLTPCPVFNFAG